MPSQPATENQNVINIDCLGSTTELQLDRNASLSYAEGTSMVTVDTLQTCRWGERDFHLLQSLCASAAHAPVV